MALRVVAGAQGFRTTTPIRSEGGLRVIGFRTVRGSTGDSLELAPHAIGWIVGDVAATGSTTGLSSLPNVPPWSLPLLRPGRGRSSDVRIFGGEAPFRDEVPTGVVRPVFAKVLVLVPGHP